MAKEAKTAQVNLRLAPSLKEAAERAAVDDQRSLTSLVEKLLSDHLKAHGYLGGNATGTLSNEPHLATAELPAVSKTKQL